MALRLIIATFVCLPLLIFAVAVHVGAGREFPAFALIIETVGAMSNMAAVWANGGKMPVLGERRFSRLHQPMRKSTRFKFLCDWVPTGLGKVSLGDVLIWIGILSFCLASWLSP